MRWMMHVWDNRGREHGVDAVGQAFEPVTDREEHVLDPAGPQFGEHRIPGLRRLPIALSGLYPQDLFMWLFAL